MFVLVYYKTCIIFAKQLNNTTMTTANKNLTGEFIKYPNGVVMTIYSQMTKKGLRYYRYYRGRFQIIGRLEIDQLAYNKN